MSSLNLTRVVALGIAATIALGAATPAFAKTHPRGGVPAGEYVYNPGDSRCFTDEGYGRRSSCDGGGS
jgi:hypothetical protein